MTQGDIVNVVIIKGDGNITTIINGNNNNVSSISKGTGHLSAQAAGRRSIKSVHGSYLRAIEPDWKVDTVWRGAAAWENWYIEDWNGKGRGAPNKPGQFLRAYSNGSVDLGGAHPKDDSNMLWYPHRNDDGSWSFLSVHGTWLSANSDGSVCTKAKRDSWEHFWLESW